VVVEFEEDAGRGQTNFCSKMFQIDDKGVHTLAAWVKGKSDPKPVLRNTYADLHEDYEIDLVLHLMVYLQSTGIQSGILFPDTSPGAATGNQIPYKKYLARLKFLFINILGKDPATVCVGPHTLRKTVYLFGVYAMLHQFASLVMIKGKCVRVGTHTLRKTAHLFGVYAMLHQFASHVMKNGKYSSLICWLLFCVL
jgi:hypothetical protein